MSQLRRGRRLGTSAFGLIPAIASVVLACGLLAVGPAGAEPRTQGGHPAGSIGSALTIAGAQDMAGDHPFDVAAAADGTAYIGWIADTVNSGQLRSIHLCTLPVEAKACRGGVQTVQTDGASTASDLHVFATRSGAELVWFHNTAQSINGPQGGAVAEATAVQGQQLGAPHDIRSAPSNGSLLDAEIAPGGALWTLAYAGVGTRTLQVDDGTGISTVRAPYAVGEGQLAFTARGTLLAVGKAGAISSPVSYSYHPNGGRWSAFATVAGTWTNGGLTVKGTARGLRLVTGVDNASYQPVIAAWNGSGFDRRRQTVDRNACGPSSHDGSTDTSGRLVDASWECNDVTVADYADGAHAAITRIKVGGTPTYAPQVGESTRGLATVAWTNESAKGGSVLHASRLRLATASRVVSRHAKGGTVHVTGPVSCLGASNTPVKVTGHASHGWTLLRRSLHLGSSSVSGSFVDGSALRPGSTYTLHGDAVFGKASARSTASAELTFRTC